MNNDRLKFRVWDKSLKTYYNQKTHILFEDGFLGEHDFGEVNQEKYIVEMCTGLRDKNGNLIFESDYVKANDVIYRVFWNKTKISLASILNGDIIDMPETITMEIVGNEHEKDSISKIPKNTERRFN